MAIIGSTDLGNGLLAVLVDEDPAINPPDVPKGSLIIWTETGIWFRQTETSQPESNVGYSGYSGVDGFSGYSGGIGVSGFSGISGYSGISGISGYSGIVS